MYNGKEKLHPSAERVRSLFEYDAESGRLRWRTRTDSKRTNWNQCFAGKLVGSPKANGYLECHIDNTLYLVHRLIWIHVNGDIPNGMLIDHADGDRTNNRPGNLRLSTKSQNTANQKKKHDRALPKGVWWHRGKYVAGIKVRGEVKHLGRFVTAEEAGAAYAVAASEGFGEFARVE